MKPKKQFTLCVFLLISVGFMTSCQKTQTASAEQLAAQYGANPQDPTALATQPIPNTPLVAGATAGDQGGTNRFGFGGSEIESPVKPLWRDTESHSPVEERTKLKDRLPLPNLKKNVAETPKIEAPKPPAAPQSDSNIVKLGFATSVPGDQLHVTLPGEYASLGPISVEKIDPAGNSLGSSWARGTQMQIPNPAAAGGKIYFKVP